MHYKELLPPTMPPPSVRHIKLPTQAGGAAQKEGGLEESVRKAKCDSFPLYWENESGCWQTLGTKMVCDAIPWLHESMLTLCLFRDPTSIYPPTHNHYVNQPSTNWNM